MGTAVSRRYQYVSELLGRANDRNLSSFDRVDAINAYLNLMQDEYTCQQSDIGYYTTFWLMPNSFTPGLGSGCRFGDVLISVAGGTTYSLAGSQADAANACCRNWSRPLGGVTAPGNNLAQVTINRQTGLTFQKQVSGALGAQPAGPMTGTMLSGASYTTIPDGLLSNGGLLEVKGGQYISLSPQLQAQTSIGQAVGGPGNMLVVRPGATVSGPAIQAFGHTPTTPTIFRFNPATGTFTPY